MKPLSPTQFHLTVTADHKAGPQFQNETSLTVGLCSVRARARFCLGARLFALIFFFLM
jgi:hypothetical protein